MGIGSGIGSSLGYAAETTYGTYVPPDHFADYESETYEKDAPYVQGGGLSAGMFQQPASQRSFPTEQAKGGHVMKARDRGMGFWISQFQGSSAAPVVQGASIAYLQTHVFGDNFGKSATIQVAVPQRDGTIRVKTIKGSKINSLEFSCGVNEELMVTVDIDGQRFSQVETLAAPSYANPRRAFHGGMMSLKLGTFGAEANAAGVKKVTLKLERSMDDDAFYAGAAVAGTKDQPVMNDWFKASGTIDTDYKSKVDFEDRFHTNAATSFVWDFTSTLAIASTYFPNLNFALPQVFITGPSAKVDGTGAVGLSATFEGQYDGTNNPCTIKYMSADVTV